MWLLEGKCWFPENWSYKFIHIFIYHRIILALRIMVWEISRESQIKQGTTVNIRAMAKDTILEAFLWRIPIYSLVMD